MAYDPNVGFYNDRLRSWTEVLEANGVHPMSRIVLPLHEAFRLSVRLLVADLLAGRRCHHCQEVIPAPPPTGEPRLCAACLAAGRTIEPPPF